MAQQTDQRSHMNAMLRRRFRRIGDNFEHQIVSLACFLECEFFRGAVMQQEPFIRQ